MRRERSRRRSKRELIAPRRLKSYVRRNPHGQFNLLVNNNRQRESPLPVPQTQLALHRRVQRNAFRCRGVHQQSRSFVLRCLTAETYLSCKRSLACLSNYQGQFALWLWSVSSWALTFLICGARSSNPLTRSEKAKTFHGRFLPSEEFWLQNCAILCNALQTQFVSLTYDSQCCATQRKRAQFVRLELQIRFRREGPSR
jgi:hypothetical protein